MGHLIDPVREALIPTEGSAVLEPVDFIARLAAMVPSPRVHFR